MGDVESSEGDLAGGLAAVEPVGEALLVDVNFAGDLTGFEVGG